jgi:hypothetical protein
MSGKTGGLGDNFYIGGVDLSGDINSIGQLGGGPALLDVTAINESANERIGGLRAGDWQFVSFMEYAPAASAPSFPLTNTIVTSAYANAVLVTITGGTVTDVYVNGSVVGTGDGTYVLPSLGTIKVIYTGSPSWTWTAVGTAHNALSALPTTDTIGTYMRGTTLQAPAACINARQINYDPTRDASGNLTLAVELQSDGYGMEWGEQLTAGLRSDTTATTGSAITDAAGTAYGAQAYVQLVEFAGTSVTVTIDHCTTSGGSYSSLMATTAMTGIGAQRLSVSNTTTVDQYLKVATTGTFTLATFAVVFMRNLTAGQVF